MNKILNYRGKIAELLNRKKRKKTAKIKKLEENSVNPARYWKIFIFSSALLLIVLILFNLYFFWFLNRIDIYRAAEKNNIETSDTEKEHLEKIINDFNKRAKRFE